MHSYQKGGYALSSKRGYNMIKAITKKLNKKHKGFSDLVSSLIAIAGLITVAVVMINVIADVNTRIQLDQVARKYILMLEAADIDDYTSTIANIRDDVWAIPAVKETAAFSKSKNDIKVSISPSAGNRHYGDRLTLVIEAPMSRVNFFYNSNGANQGRDISQETRYADTGTNVNGSFGKIRRNVYSTAIIKKQTTIKY